MTLIVMLLALLASGWGQSLFPPLLIMGQARPPLLAAVVVFYAVYFPVPVMLTAAVLGGILYDANSLLPLGVSALFYCVVCALVQRHQDVWIEGGAVSAAVLTALTAVGQQFVAALADILLWDRAGLLPGGWFRHMVAATGMGIPAGIAIFYVLERLHRMTGTIKEAVNP